MGYLARDASQKRYCLGPGVLSLGHPLLASMPVRQVAGPLLQALARQTGCSVNLAMRDRDQVVYVSAVRADANSCAPFSAGQALQTLRQSCRARVLAAGNARA